MNRLPPGRPREKEPLELEDRKDDGSWLKIGGCGELNREDVGWLEGVGWREELKRDP